MVAVGWVGDLEGWEAAVRAVHIPPQAVFLMTRCRPRVTPSSP